MNDSLKVHNVSLTHVAFEHSPVVSTNFKQWHIHCLCVFVQDNFRACVAFKEIMMILATRSSKAREALLSQSEVNQDEAGVEDHVRQDVENRWSAAFLMSGCQRLSPGRYWNGEAQILLVCDARAFAGKIVRRETLHTLHFHAATSILTSRYFQWSNPWKVADATECALSWTGKV